MPSLRELQRGFSAATMFGDDAALSSLAIVPGGLDPKQRIAIYRNNVFGNYCKVLGATYPVVRRLVGASFFAAATEHFVRAHPSTRGDVNGYGGDFARFLEAYAPARQLAYLPDVARLEWAIDQVGIAADAGPLDLAALGAVAPDAHAQLRFRLHPAARLIASSFPLLAIWQFNQPDYAGEDHVDLTQGGDTLLVMRGAQGVGIERIGRGEHALLAALAANATLGIAAERALLADADFDLTAALRQRVASHTLVAFRTPPATHGDTK
jgi:Putative DNA-binding domain